MKIFVLLFSLCLFVFPVLADASVINSFLKQAGDKAYYGGNAPTDGPPSPAVVVGNIIQEVLIFVSVILFAIIAYAGVVWLTAAGSEERVSKAKDLLTNSIWGMVIIAGAYVIAYFVTERVFDAAIGIKTGTSLLPIDEHFVESVRRFIS